MPGSRPRATRRDVPSSIRPLPRRLRVLRRDTVYGDVRVCGVRNMARVAPRRRRRSRAHPSACLARRDRGTVTNQRGRHGGEEDGARGASQGGAREGCRASGCGGGAASSRAHARACERLMCSKHAAARIFALDVTRLSRKNARRRFGSREEGRCAAARRQWLKISHADRGFRRRAHESRRPEPE